jgi:NAD(P)H-flavin reductase
VIAIIGARTKDLLILEDKMKAASHELHVCTDDGSYGHHGFVTDVLKSILDKKDVKMVVGIGPVPMMKFLSKLTKEYGVKNARQPQCHHGRRHGHVRMLPGDRRRGNQVRLCGRPGV